MTAVLLANAAATWLMLGVILVVQVVHYPLFARVGRDGFGAYEQAHARRITWVVLPPMTVELLTAVALVWRPAPALPAAQAWAGLALVGVIWASTALLQVPAHSRLAQGFSAAAHRRLVRSNWIRTVAWAARAVLVSAAIAR